MSGCCKWLIEFSATDNCSISGHNREICITLDHWRKLQRRKLIFFKWRKYFSSSLISLSVGSRNRFRLLWNKIRQLSNTWYLVTRRGKNQLIWPYFGYWHVQFTLTLNPNALISGAVWQYRPAHPMLVWVMRLNREPANWQTVINHQQYWYWNSEARRWLTPFDG